MAASTGLSASDLALLAKYDTPTICNVIEMFDVRPRNTGFMDQRITAAFPQMPPMVGYAATATYRTSVAPKTSCSMSALAATLADVPSPSIIVMQDIDEPTMAASFGDIMCSTFKAFGSAGLITSGAGRDLDQVEAMGFPVFVGSVICAHGYCHIPSVAVPVHVGGVMINPGQLLHGDRNGVTTIPHEIASEVAHVTEDFIATEKAVIDYVQNTSEPTVEGLDAAVAECKSMHEALCKRIRKGR
jgi:4-hydroxy-4-methyl-2-oxoglutarate aldolase